MGLEALGDERAQVKAIADLLGSIAEKSRRREARKRTALYRDDYAGVLQDYITVIFNEPAVRQRLVQLIPLVGSTSFLKRVSDEVARPIYAISPMRRVVKPVDFDTPDTSDTSSKAPKPSPEQEAWNALAAEMQLDSRMDLLARLLVCCNDVFLQIRYVEGYGLCADILTPEMVSVIADRDNPTRALAIMYDVATDANGNVSESIVWDDKVSFRVNAAGQRITQPVAHQFGRIPIIELHRRSRWGCYWDSTTGNDLVAGALSSMFLDLIVIKKIKAQSHLQLAYVGDPDKLIKDQVTDEESILVALGGGGQFQILNLESDPQKIITAKESVETAVAANYGISRERLNQTTTKQDSDDVALQERVAELAKVMIDAEQEVFELVKTVSALHPELKGKIGADSKLMVDLGQLHNRVDRATLLAVRQAERSMGLRSGVDDVLEDNPEFAGDRKRAMAFIREKMGEEAIIVEERRKLNIPADVVSEQPGSNPKFNGALGPAVRDGSMSKDEAADASAAGTVKTAGIPNTGG